MKRFLWFAKTSPRLALAAILYLAAGTVRNGWGQATPAPPPAPAAPPAASVAPDDVVLTIGERQITKAEFESIAQALPPQFAGAMGQLGPRGFADQYANLLSLAMEGEKRKLNENESFQKMMEFQRLMLLGQITLNALASSTTVIPTQEVLEYYTSHTAEFQEVKLRGVYVPFDGSPAASPEEEQGEGQQEKGLTEDEALAKAKTLRDRLVAGEDMGEMAANESDHPTAAKNGEFGFIRRNQFSPEIDRVIFSLELNEVSQPVRDRFGFFLFRVEEKRPQPLDQAKPLIENALRQQKLGGLLGKLKQDYPVTMNPDYFPPAAQPAGMPPGMQHPPQQ